MNNTDTQNTIVRRYFTGRDIDPYDGIEWSTFDVRIKGTDDDGNETVVFEQLGVTAPSTWSQNAVDIVTSKYFRGRLGTAERETSVKQIIDRVVHRITDWGVGTGYFVSDDEARVFSDELKYILVRQYACFNSPVWFNLGTTGRQQASACYINPVDDTLASILALNETEGRLFQWGSGTGTNLSHIRSSKEFIDGGGHASGPVSFMRGYDAWANVIKSGGRTRRSAKMQILDADHPDILDFIDCKADEEKKAHALIGAGYEGSVNGEAYQSVFFQNSNLSVRMTDEFMKAVEEDLTWELKSRPHPKTGETYTVETVKAREVFSRIAQRAWECGDPGVQFDTTINNYNTCADDERIRASNPCSEYMWFDSTACNLSSINLVAADDMRDFTHIVEVMILAKDIIVGSADYPTDEITEKSHLYRTLGLGYANLGALLMRHGVAYDSHEGRNIAASITSLMAATAWNQSAAIAERMGAFPAYERNARHVESVRELHADAAQRVKHVNGYGAWLDESIRLWDTVAGEPIRNAQLTLLAPTGTIAFMMDCDTTGVEPDISLVKYKKLVGGGVMKIANQSVRHALKTLGYEGDVLGRIDDFIAENGNLDRCTLIDEEHLPVFDCAFSQDPNARSISPEGHVDMMAAVQPFLCGAISKTVNMPNSATVEDIEAVYRTGWRKGLKAIAVYRDGCKLIQPYSTKSNERAETGVAKSAEPLRRKLPNVVKAKRIKINVSGHEGYMHVGEFDNGQPGEVFITMSKTGSTINGLMDAIATSWSIMLQYGVPLATLCAKFEDADFEPRGVTRDEDVPFAKSIVDFCVRKLAAEYLYSDGEAVAHEYTGAVCSECGSTNMRRSGSCHVCENCGATTGCG